MLNSMYEGAGVSAETSWKKAQANQSAVLVELETAVAEKRVACVVGGISGGDAVVFWRRRSLARKK